MEKMDKPIPCKEKWSNMTPAEGGRICKSCTKLIVDFRKKTWAEIEKKQSENNNSICGIYSKRQLNNWGQEITTKSEHLKKIAAVAAISTALTINTFAQSDSKENKSITIHGTISTLPSDTFNQGPISNASVKLDSTKTLAITDSNGHYSISILKSKIQTNKIMFSANAENYESKAIIIQLDTLKGDSIELNAALEIKQHEPLFHLETQTISFYATPPTLLDTAKEKIKSLIKTK